MCLCACVYVGRLLTAPVCVCLCVCVCVRLAQENMGEEHKHTEVKTTHAYFASKHVPLLGLQSTTSALPFSTATSLPTTLRLVHPVLGG